MNLAAGSELPWPARNEATKYTRLERLGGTPVAAGDGGASPLAFDGVLRVDAGAETLPALPQGLHLERCHGLTVKAPSDALASVNDGEARGTLRLIVSGAIETPLHLAWHGGAGRRAERLVVELEPNASLCLIETFTATATTAKQHGNPVAEVTLGAGARLDHVSLQSLPHPAAFTQAFAVAQGRDSSYRGWAIDLGAGLARRDVSIDLSEPGASCAYFGLLVPRAGEHVDHHLTVHHRAPNCRSEQQVRGIVAPGGRAVFTGRVVVAEGASATAAEQMSRGLLLGDGAEFDSRPQLEIYTDDVVASHGSTCGQLDAQALFFLRARGLSEEQARTLLAQAFGAVVIDDLPSPPIAELVRTELCARVAQ
jgi:Fe-S cluster assembly protein SufD